MLQPLPKTIDEKIHYTKPSISYLEVAYAQDAAINGWGPNCYGYIDRFEGLFKSHLGVRHAIATSSCTGALHMGLAALGIGPGDEVILADSNWIACAAPITYLGAKPVFVDILSDSWCIDPTLAEAAITPKTKAILAVHLYGNLCEMDRLLDIGARYNIAIIEDGAEAIGSLYHGKRAGSMGLFSTFSFHGSKTVSTGEGGMLVTNDANFYDHVLTLSNHGRAKGEKRQFWPSEIGFKYRISNIQAAIGCAQMERIELLIERKRDILAHYRHRLAPHGLVMNPEREGTVLGAWMPTVLFERESDLRVLAREMGAGSMRDRVIAQMAAANIDARPFFHPLTSLPMFDSVPNTNAYEIPKRAINLPSYHELRDDDMERVIETLLDAI